MQVALTTLGCRLNEAEIESWGRDFEQLGFALSQDLEAADILVVNTCAVTREAVKKSRQLIRRTRRNNPRAKLVVSGCYGSLHPEISGEIDGIDLLVPNQDKDHLARLTCQDPGPPGHAAGRHWRIRSFPVQAESPAGLYQGSGRLSSCLYLLYRHRSAG